VRRLVGVSHDQRLRRTAELMISVAVGIAVAEPLIGFSALGRGKIAVLVATLLPGLYRLNIAAVHADYALRNTRILARRALAALREGDVLSPALSRVEIPLEQRLQLATHLEQGGGVRPGGTLHGRGPHQSVGVNVQ
jgi:hypothetical protein